MKHLTAILLSFLVATLATAQGTIDSWAQKVSLFGRSVPQEKVFIHTDNQCYFIGDTIFFRAYLTRSDTHRPSGLSGVLYVELLNSDGYLMERQNVKIEHGMGSGSIVLDPQTCLYAGYYEMRAYTRWMLNWGLTEYPHTTWSEQWFFNKSMAKNYYRDYEKLYSRVFPVYDKPAVPGEYHRDMTERPMRRTFAEDDTHLRPSITLYPEGGDMTSGVPCRVAFEARDGEGRHLRGKLRIATPDGTVVAEAETQNRGRGVVRFTPQARTRYQCTFINGQDSHKVKVPEVKEQGVALEARVTGTSLDITVQPHLTGNEELGMTIMAGGVVEKTFDLGTHGMKHSISLDELPTGVLDITVFDSEGRVYADRLVFNTGSSGTTLEGNRIEVACQEKMVQAYKPIHLTLKSGSKTGGTVSVAVFDQATSDDIYDNGTLLTEMLLASEIRGFVEDPGYYFEANDEEHRTALDLLLMVQGWRRFDWKTMAQPKESGFAINHPYEHETPIMYGQVNKYRTVQSTDIFLQLAQGDAQQYMSSNDTNPWAEAGGEEGSETVTSGIEELGMAVQQATGMHRQDAENGAERFDKNYGSLKREVMVHAEFSQPGSPPLTGEMETQQGRFKIQAPSFDGECYFFLAASDTTRWGRKGHNWVQVNKDDVLRRELPEFYVWLDQPYPRFAQPYTFYQTAPAERRTKKTVKAAGGLFDDHQLDEVIIRVGRNSVRAFDARFPAIDVDAIKAFNYAIDAGLCTGQYIGYHRFCNDVARAYIGDMGMERQYTMQIRLDEKNSSSNQSEGERNAYNDIATLNRVKIYTDFSPRRMGDSRWTGSDQPVVIVDLQRLPNQGKRITYRDRRIILPGFAICEEFYNPDYSTMALPKQPDVRRTLYWNPALALDDNGEATVTLYRNSRPGEVVVTVNGFTSDGLPLSGEYR